MMLGMFLLRLPPPTTTVVDAAAATALIQNRRAFIQKGSSSATTTISLLFLPPTGNTAESNSPTAAASPAPPPAAAGVVETVRVPIQYVPSLSAYVVQYTIGGDRFRAIVDTGSPFLTVPNYCAKTANKNRWGCYHSESSVPSGLPDTTERFDNNQGLVMWRRAPFSFINATGSMIGRTPLFTFGVLTESLMGGSGGVFFGLVRDTNKRIRPSFLSQTPVRAFQIDLKSPSNGEKSLTLTSGIAEENLLSSSSTLPNNDNYIRLVNDLNLKYGDPTIHYTAKATSITVNGQPLLASRTDKKKKKPLYVIFDTGVSGMVVSSELFEERYNIARQNRERNLWGNVTIGFPNGMSITSCYKPVTTPLGQKPWPNFNNAHLIVAGLAFLDNHVITVDIDKQKLWLD